MRLLLWRYECEGQQYTPHRWWICVPEWLPMVNREKQVNITNFSQKSWEPKTQHSMYPHKRKRMNYNSGNYIQMPRYSQIWEVTSHNWLNINWKLVKIEFFQVCFFNCLSQTHLTGWITFITSTVTSAVRVLYDFLHIISIFINYSSLGIIWTHNDLLSG